MSLKQRDCTSGQFVVNTYVYVSRADDRSCFVCGKGPVVPVQFVYGVVGSGFHQSAFRDLCGPCTAFWLTIEGEEQKTVLKDVLQLSV